MAYADQEPGGKTSRLAESSASAQAPGSPWSMFAGPLGLFFVFLGGLLGLVVFFEYHPEGKVVLKEGVPTEAIVLGEKPADAPGRMRLRLQLVPPDDATQSGTELDVEAASDPANESDPVLRRELWSQPVNANTARLLPPGSRVTVLFAPDRPERAFLRRALPHAPRDAGDFGVPAVFFGIGALLLVFAPRYLYLGSTLAPAEFALQSEREAAGLSQPRRETST